MPRIRLCQHPDCRSCRGYEYYGAAPQGQASSQGCKIASSTSMMRKKSKITSPLLLPSILDGIIKDGDIIGVAGGTTCTNMSQALISRSIKGSQVVQLEGGLSNSEWNNYSREILENFANNFNTVAQYLPLPVILITKLLRSRWTRIDISNGYWSWAVMPILPCSA